MDPGVVIRVDLTSGTMVQVEVGSASPGVQVVMLSGEETPFVLLEPGEFARRHVWASVKYIGHGN